LDAVAQKLLDHLLEVERPRSTIHQSQQDNAGRLFQGRILVELVEDAIRVLAALDVNHQAHRAAAALAALVADLANALDPLVLDQLADGLCKAVARLLKGHFRDDDLRPIALLLDVGAGAQRDLAPASHVAVHNSLPTADDAARWEVGARDDLHQV